MKISTIVPLYNDEEYVENTLNSLVNQSIFEDIEVIIVDDGSNDNSKYLIEKFSLDYANINAFHKENEGLTFTRNYGMDLAKGEYIHFMDSDDYIPPDAYERMYDLARKHDHDIVSGHFLRFNDTTIDREVISTFICRTITETIESTTLEESEILAWDSVVWNKLYKNSFLKQNNIRFPNERITYEDNIFSMESYCKAKSIGFLDYDVYYWRRRPYNTSLSTENELKTFIDRYRIMKMVNRCMIDNNCSEKIIEMKYLKWLNEDLKNMAILIPKLGDESYFDHIREILNLGSYRLIDELDDYRRLLYRIILEGNLDDLREFKRNSKSKKLSEKFGHFDFKSNSLNAHVSDIRNSEKTLFLDFKSSGLAHENLEIILISDNVERNCFVEDNCIEIDLRLLDDGFNEVKLCYEIDGCKKEAQLKNKICKSVDLNDYVLEIGFTVNNALSIYKCPKDNIMFEINGITFDDGDLTFYGEFDSEISLINEVSMDQIDYGTDGNSFKIPYLDLLRSPVKRWALKSEGDFSIDGKYQFFKGNEMISIYNYSNKIVIDLEKINQTALINDLKSQLETSNAKNRKLVNENKKLNNKINQYKSRKAVKFTDKIKRLM